MTRNDKKVIRRVFRDCYQRIDQLVRGVPHCEERPYLLMRFDYSLPGTNAGDYFRKALEAAEYQAYEAKYGRRLRLDYIRFCKAHEDDRSIDNYDKEDY